MKKLPAALRVAVGVGVPAVLAAGIAFFVRFGSPPCFVHAVTGIYCPGCGAGRAIRSLLSLHVGDALQYNLLFTLALPVVLLFIVKYYLSAVTGRDIMPAVRITDRAAWICVGAVAAFLVLRNIPVKPFSYLSPDVFL